MVVSQAKEYNFLIGGSAGFELPLGDKIGITLQAGYLLPQAEADFKELLASVSMIPAQVGLKYYFQESQSGFYGHAQVGIHAFTEKFKAYDLTDGNGVTVHYAERGETQTLMSWAIGAGYQLEKLDFGVRLNMILPKANAEAEGEESGAKSYVGLRVAYLFGLGG